MNEKVLIVEDEYSHRAHLVGVLTDAGYQVESASSGREGIDLGVHFRPDVLVSDWMLQNHLHGLHVFEALCLVLPALRGVIVTGFPTKPLKSEVKRKRALQFLEKPIDAGAIERAVKAALSKAPDIEDTCVSIFEIDGNGEVTGLHGVQDLKVDHACPRLPAPFEDFFEADCKETLLNAERGWCCIKLKGAPDRAGFARVHPASDTEKTILVVRHGEENSFDHDRQLRILFGENLCVPSSLPISGRILLVDESLEDMNRLNTALEEGGHFCYRAQSASEAMNIIYRDHGIALVLLDDSIANTQNLAGDLIDINPDLTVFRTGQGNEGKQKTGSGAYIFLQKPVAISDLQRACEARDLASKDPYDQPMIGDSDVMGQLKSELSSLAVTDLNLLVLGETGSGKELVIRRIHELSGRGGHPLVIVNCAAIPKDLFESEFFGYAKGAFTGAESNRIGLIERADGGTLLLDEVAELSRDNQARLLRVIEEGIVRQVGSTSETRVDVRFVAATNTILPAKGFREDLYFRLSGATLHVPPLRIRGGDIMQLANHFLTHATPSGTFAPREFDEGAVAFLAQHKWRGNVRELKNLIQRAAAVAEGPRIDRRTLEKAADTTPPWAQDPSSSAKIESLRVMEEAHIRNVIVHCGGNMSKAAKILGVSRSTLYNKLADYNH